MVLQLHNSKNRSPRLTGLGNSKLSTFITHVNRYRDKHRAYPEKKFIVDLMADLEITNDPVEAWRMWNEDCKPLMAVQ